MDYHKHKDWGQVGWLGSGDYAQFWACIFVERFRGRSVIDVGSGDGKIWLEAFGHGLKVTDLHLIEPACAILPELSGRAVHHSKALQDVCLLQADVAVFKQSLHHIYGDIGLRCFDYLDVEQFVNYSMPLECDWPMSSQFRALYMPSVQDVEAIVQNAGMRVIERRMIDYPVTMSRAEWCIMLERRFTSVLHSCDDEFIAAEVVWAQKNLPDILSFNDCLECIVFSK